MKYFFWFIAVLIIIFILLAIDIISPQDMTMTSMNKIKYRMGLYVQMYNKIPKSLNELPKRPNSKNSIVDGWNRPIQYSYDEETETVTLLSCGKKRDCACPSEGDCIISTFKLSIDSNKNF